ncbi:unnamed protein product [Chrysoparadoxa australica]
MSEARGERGVVKLSASDAQVVSAATKGGSLLMMMALVQRVTTFSLNLLLQRSMMGPDAENNRVQLEAYGAAAISLELLLSMAVFLRREPFRLALARSSALHSASSLRSREAQQVVNVAWLSLPFGILTSALVWRLFPLLLGLSNPSGSSSRDGADMMLSHEYQTAATMVCGAAAIEALCEPFILIYQARLHLGVRVRAESLAVLVLGASRYFLVAHLSHLKLGILAYGLAQLLHSLAMVAVLGVSVGMEVWHRRGKEATMPSERFSTLSGWLPGPVTGGALFGPDGQNEEGYLSLICMLCGHALLKNVLTEGDKIVLSKQDTLYQQGIYAMAHNYGSLVARVLFQPLEESARLAFSRIGAGAGMGRQSDDASEHNLGSEKARDGLAALFPVMLKLVLLLGLLFPCLGSSYTAVLLQLLLGKRANTEPALVAHVLAWYCLYVLFLALNGMLEALVAAVVKKKQVTGLSAGLVASFALFWASAPPLMATYGTAGLVMANCCAMSGRILASVSFILYFFEGQGSVFWRACPHPLVMLFLLISMCVTQWSKFRALEDAHPVQAAAKHVALGVGCLLVTGKVFIAKEQAFIGSLRQLWQSRGMKTNRSRSPGSKLQ